MGILDPLVSNIFSGITSFGNGRHVWKPHENKVIIYYTTRECRQPKMDDPRTVNKIRQAVRNMGKLILSVSPTAKAQDILTSDMYDTFRDIATLKIPSLFTHLNHGRIIHTAISNMLISAEAIGVGDHSEQQKLLRNMNTLWPKDVTRRMTYEARQKKLDNEDKLLTLEELHEDLRLLKEGILKELACPRVSESAYIDLA